MATTKDQYDNLFGSSDEESDAEEQAVVPPPPPSSSAAAAARPSASAPSSDEESSSEEEEEEQTRKRISKVPKKRVTTSKAAASDSDKEEDDRNGSKNLGGSGLDRAAADYQDSEGERGGRGGSDSDSESESSGEEHDHRKKGKKKGKRGSGASKPRQRPTSSSGGAAPGRELSTFEQAMKNLKRPRSQKLPDNEIAEMTNRLIELMETAAKEDRMLLSQGRPATQKLKKLEQVMKYLKSKHLQGALVDNGSLLGLIRQWLQPLPDKSLPLFAIRTPLIDYLVHARVEVHRLKESKIGQVIQQLNKHADETVENKAKLREIIDNWSRLITGKGTSVKARSSEDVDERVPEQNRGRGGGNDGYYVRTARGVEIPIRTGYTFKKVALTYKEEFDRGQGKEDEAMEVVEREPRDAESRASKVRKALKDMGRKGTGKKLRAINVSTSAL